MGSGGWLRCGFAGAISPYLGRWRARKEERDLIGVLLFFCLCLLFALALFDREVREKERLLARVVPGSWGWAGAGRELWGRERGGRDHAGEVAALKLALVVGSGRCFTQGVRRSFQVRDECGL